MIAGVFRGRDPIAKTHDARGTQEHKCHTPEAQAHARIAPPIIRGLALRIGRCLSKREHRATEMAALRYTRHAEWLRAGLMQAHEQHSGGMHACMALVWGNILKLSPSARHVMSGAGGICAHTHTVCTNYNNVDNHTKRCFIWQKCASNSCFLAECNLRVLQLDQTCEL